MFIEKKNRVFDRISKAKFISKKKKQDASDLKRYSCWRNLRNLNKDSIELLFKQTDFFSFKHSGHLGDIIYSLPVIRQLTQRFCKHPSELNLNLYSKVEFSDNNIFFKEKIYHPSGKYLLTADSFNCIKPLLEFQDYISRVNIYNNEHVDFDLDYFRSCLFCLDRGNISKWYQSIIPINLSLEQPWLKSEKVYPDFKDHIVIARSTRYRWNDLSYSFLKKYPKVSFVGLEYEYELMKDVIPNLNYIQTNNFLELANVISSAKLFIGNQSSPFSIAEGLKVNRLLEVYQYAPNVDPVGGNCSVFSSQACFEFLVKDFYENY